jgi:hypothetical protein
MDEYIYIIFILFYFLNVNNPHMDLMKKKKKKP